MAAIDDAIAAMQQLQAAQDRLAELVSERTLRQSRIQELAPMVQAAQTEVTDAKAAAKVAVKAAFGL